MASSDATAALHSSALALAAASGDADPVLNKHEVATLVGFSVSTLDREVAAGRFPPPIMLSVRRVGWRASTVRGWSEARPVRTP